MANNQKSSRGENSSRHNDLIRCENCGEYYSVTYKRCPFCDERPEQSGGSGGHGRRLATNKRGGGYGGPVNPVQIALLILSLVLVIAAVFIVFKSIAPLFHKNPAGDSSTSTSISTPGGTSGSSSSSTPASGLTLDRTELSLAAGASETLTVTLPDGTQGEVTWTTSDATVATVDADGKVTNTNAAASEATATITATVGENSTSCTVVCAGTGSTTGGNTGSQTGTTPSTGTIAPNTECVITNAEGGLRIRSGPGTSYDVQVSTANGASVTVLADAGDGWYKIKYTLPGGKSAEGYVKHEYVTPAPKS